ncbi:unnamed protein product [Euphydryas editha]|uniref:Uncharacterized protein n=1 Tax=Euphydryas editha TaxID=104508 RepID=A0AAU9UX51_EUPED|nr:unnamed protein product [Euphydryas editha]
MPLMEKSSLKKLLTVNFNLTYKFKKYIQSGHLFLEPKDRPENLLFTAPFRICKGQCKTNVSNYFMQFPIYIGLKGNKKNYQNLYPRDHENIHSTRENAPFRKSSTRVPYILCPPKNKQTKEPFMSGKCPVLHSILILLSTTYCSVQGTLPWDRWSWSAPQAPIEHFFRRYDSNIMPIKTPSLKCECPPNKECNMEYEINEDMLYFQNLKGIIKDNELKQLKEDFNKINYRKNKTIRKNYNETELLTRKRRRSDVILNSKDTIKDCCCPTKIVRVPAFITNQKFDEVIERINKKPS